MLIYAWRDISTSVFAIEPLFWICIFLTLFRDVINYGYCFMHLIWCLTLLQLHTILKNILWHSIVHVIDQSNRGRSTVEKLYSENTSPWWIMKNAEEPQHWSCKNHAPQVCLSLLCDLPLLIKVTTYDRFLTILRGKFYGRRRNFSRTADYKLSCTHYFEHFTITHLVWLTWLYDL